MGWYDRKVRRVRDLSCGDTRIFLELEVRRIDCRRCGKVKRAFEVYDFSNNAITSAASLAVTYPMGTVASQWTVAGFGDFSGNANETDMLLRNSNTGAFEVYDISHNAVTSATVMGQVGLEWQVGGIAAVPPAAASPAGSIPLLVQAMASLGASAAVHSAPSAVPGGADTPQQTLLSIPPH
jgi:hypothetical protein